MKIAVLGRGNMGSPLADLARQAGHEVAELGSDSDVLAFLQDADLVILALHFDPAKELLSGKTVRNALVGKTLIDITNPLAPDYMSLTIGHETSAGETLAALVPKADVVKAFNTVFADLLKAQANGTDAPVPVYVAGDEADARRTVVDFVEGIGMVPIDCGPLSNARYLEPMAEMMIQLGYGLGHGADIGFALVKAS